MLVRILVFVAGLLAAGSSFGRAPKLEVVDHVDLDRYLGTWYEIASFPAWFQRNCTAVSATYTLREDGLVKVVNACRKGSLDGERKESVGRARIVDSDTNAKLEVSFFGPFWGDYWIIDLDPDYQWVVVGVPSRKYLWILSRTRTMDEELFETIVAALPAKGFDVTRLERTLQPSE